MDKKDKTLKKDKFTGFLFMFLSVFIALFLEEIITQYSIFNIFSTGLFNINIPYGKNVVSFLICLVITINSIVIALIIGNRINVIAEEIKNTISIIISPPKSISLHNKEEKVK